MLIANQRIVAQLPPKIPSQRLMRTIRGRSHALVSSLLIRPVASSVSRSMVRSALLATRREFSASLPSSRAVNSSMSRRSLASRLRSRSVKSPALEFLSIQLPFQPPPVPGFGVQRCQVVSALARHFDTRLLQSRDDIGPIPHCAARARETGDHEAGEPAMARSRLFRAMPGAALRSVRGGGLPTC